MTMSGRSQNPSGPDSRYEFTGKERDYQTTGLDYFGARNYDSWRGQWAQVDPNGQGPFDFLVNLVQKAKSYIQERISSIKAMINNGANASIKDDKLTQGKVENLKALVNINLNYQGYKQMGEAAEKIEKVATITSLVAHSGQVITAPLAETPLAGVPIAFGSAAATADVVGVGAQFTQGFANGNSKKLLEGGASILMMGGTSAGVKAFENAVPSSEKILNPLMNGVLSNTSTGTSIIIDEATKDPNQ